MNKNTLILATLLSGTLVMSVWASRAGWGALHPAKNPPSLREESAREGKISRGHYRTRYFIGGGFVRGK